MAYRSSKRADGRRSRSARRYSKKKPKTTYGKLFRTKRGRYGSYKYVNGRRVAFVTKSKRR